MSEYQFLQFLALDRRLTREEMAGLRKISSRADITPTSLTNEYHFGNFKGDEYQLLQTHFDVFYYYADWGIQRLIFRLPLEALDAQTLDSFAVEPEVELHQFEQCLLVEFVRDQQEDDFWSDDDGVAAEEDYPNFETDHDPYGDCGEANLAELVPIRSLLLGGDTRPLYLGWLAAVASGSVSGGAKEPVVPPGLASLEPELQRFAQWLRVGPPWLQAAAEASRPLAPELSYEDTKAWLRAQPQEIRDDWLVELIRDRTSGTRMRLQGMIVSDQQSSSRDLKSKRRTASHLRERAKALQLAVEAAERERLAKIREERLREVAKDEQKIWGDVHRLIAGRSSRDHGRAIELLVDLRDMAESQSRSEEMRFRIDQLHRQHQRRRSLIDRLRQAKLLSD